MSNNFFIQKGESERSKVNLEKNSSTKSVISYKSD